MALYELEYGASRHNSVRGHILALLRYGSHDETGVQFALATLYERFVDVVGPDRKGGHVEAEKEFVKMVASVDRLLGDEESEPLDPFGTKARRREAAASCTVMGLDGAHRVFRKWLGDEYDADALDAMLAAAAVEQLDGDPLWLLLISGSGNAKTETVQALAGVSAIITSTISSAGALLSATPKKEIADNATGGLLRRLEPDGVLVVKDVTSILSMSGDARAEVLAALREVYDGRWSRNVGTNGGMTLEWQGRIAMIGAVTTAWDTHHAVVATMGDRFVLVRMDSTTGRRTAGRQAIANTGSEVVMRQELADAVAGVLAGIDRTTVELSVEEADAVLAAADLVTLARTAVEYDRRGDIASAHSPEMPTRFAKQLAQVVRGAVAIGIARNDALRLAIRCARDSMPPMRLDIIDDIATHPGSTTTEVRRRLNKPRQTVDRQLQALHMLRVLTVAEEPYSDNKVRWLYSLRPEIDPKALRYQTCPDSAPYISGIN